MLAHFANPHMCGWYRSPLAFRAMTIAATALGSEKRDRMQTDSGRDSAFRHRARDLKPGRLRGGGRSQDRTCLSNEFPQSREKCTVIFNNGAKFVITRQKPEGISAA
jgi:hypothetical protein